MLLCMQGSGRSPARSIARLTDSQMRCIRAHPYTPHPHHHPAFSVCKGTPASGCMHRRGRQARAYGPALGHLQRLPPRADMAPAPARRLVGPGRRWPLTAALGVRPVRPALSRHAAAACNHSLPQCPGCPWDDAAGMGGTPRLPKARAAAVGKGRRQRGDCGHGRQDPCQPGRLPRHAGLPAGPPARVPGQRIPGGRRGPAAAARRLHLRLPGHGAVGAARSPVWGCCWRPGCCCWRPGCCYSCGCAACKGLWAGTGLLGPTRTHTLVNHYSSTS